MNNISPNQNLVPLDQAWRICRAVMVLEPEQFEIKYIGLRQHFALMLKEGYTTDIWVEYKYPDGSNWYTYVSSNGSGKSKPALHPDEKIGYTIYVTDDVKISKQLNIFLKGIENFGTHYNDAFLELLPSFNPLIPRENYRYEYPKHKTTEVISKIKRVIEAFDKSYNKKRIYEFRNRLKVQTNEVDESRKAYVCTPNDIIKFKNQLKKERNGYGIDAHLFGSIKGITDLCMLYTINKHNIQLNQFDLKSFLTFNKVIYPLTSGNLDNPVIIFGQIIQSIVQDGNFDVLKKFGSTYEEYILKNIELGLNSDNLDIHLNYFFDAVDYCFPLTFMSLQITKIQGIPDKEKKYFYRLYKRFDEILAKLILPFAYQIMDFNGDIWKMRQTHIEILNSSEVKNSVEAYLDNTIEDLWIYPRIFKNRLGKEKNEIA